MISLKKPNVSLINQILGINIAQAQVASKVGGAVDDVGSQTGSQLGNLVGNFLAQIPLWIAAIVIAFLTYIIALSVKKTIESKLAEKGIEEEHKEIQIVAGRSAFFIVIVIGITVSLSIVGIDLKPIVAAGAFGLGFALQDIIMNLISGMFILASRHYTIGDVISVNGISGKIMEIQTRATIIKAFDGTKVIVPNADLFSNVVVSKTSNPFRKLTFVMGCGYDDDLEKVREVTLNTLKDIKYILASPKPSVIFYQWDNSEILFKIKVWIDSKGGKMMKVKNDVIMKLTKAYNEADFEMPYPISTVELTSMYSPTAKLDVSLNKRTRTKLKTAASSISNAILPLQPEAVPSVMEAVTPSVIEKPSLQQPPIEVALSSAPVMPIAPELTTAPALDVAANNSLPTAIQVTANSPGQNWLEQALQSQVAQQNQQPNTQVFPQVNADQSSASAIMDNSPSNLSNPIVLPEQSPTV